MDIDFDDLFLLEEDTETALNDVPADVSFENFLQGLNVSTLPTTLRYHRT